MIKLICLFLATSTYGQQNTKQIADPSVNAELTKIVSTLTEDATTEAQNATDVNNTEQSMCTNYLGEEAKCVHQYRCNFRQRDLYEIIAPHFVEEEPCEKNLHICCPLGKIVKGISTDAKDMFVQVNKTCGYGNPNGVGFKLSESDYEAKFGEFPWMVAVLKLQPAEGSNSEKPVYKYVSGGSLIHPSIVLTVAHYLDNDPKLRIRAGEWDTQTDGELYPHQERDVRKILLHPDYLKKSLINDIGLLLLTSPVDTSFPHIGLACLPSAGEDGHAVAGTRCWSSGWGKDVFEKEGRYIVVMKKVEVLVEEHNDCEKKLRRTRLGPRFTLDSTFMCAGGEAGVDTCRSDGGAPLVCPVENERDRYVQNGIVAWSIGCGQDDIPGAYVNVANLRSWIDDTVTSHGYDPKTYSV